MTTRTLLALDIGQKRIGLAVGAGIAFGRGWVSADDPTSVLERVKEIIKTDNVEAMVIGQPHRAHGLESKMSPIIATWVARLQGETGLPVYIVDEALSSVEAEQELRRAGVDTRRDKGDVDEKAAQIILEQYWREQPDA